MIVKPNHDFIRDRRYYHIEEKPKDFPTLEELERTEWCSDFEQKCRNRMIMGALRYGRLRAKGKPQYDRIASARKRLDIYEATGNDEHLVDVANLCRLEYVEGTHPLKHFSSVDDGEHTEVKA